jgi:hypothetical protein
VRESYLHSRVRVQAMRRIFYLKYFRFLTKRFVAPTRMAVALTLYQKLITFKHHATYTRITEAFNAHLASVSWCMDVSGQIHAPALLTPKKESPYSLDRILGRRQPVRT